MLPEMYVADLNAYLRCRILSANVYEKYWSYATSSSGM